MNYTLPYITILAGETPEDTIYHKQHNAVLALEISIPGCKNGDFDLPDLKNYNNPENRFIMILSGTEEIIPENHLNKLMDFVTMALMCNSYYRHGKFIPVGLLNCNPKESWAEIINEYLEKQGIKSISYYTFSDPGLSQLKNNEKHNSLVISNNTQLSAIKQLELFDIIGLLDRFIYFRGSNLNQSVELANTLGQIIDKVIKKDIYAERVLNKLLEFDKQIKKLEVSNKELIDEIEVARSFVEIAKNKYKDDYLELFKFYQNEYESLPLWYKRFGHILKVAMGKRTLRSLFNDNVKKYKD
ncbi:MAG: hypothetical protein EKK37_07690 [Sphingobacteriales bacterium]|nr:MAG: hypothetical protein EKK37_07690 [Sphingobacteriales bacterium]